MGYEIDFLPVGDGKRSGDAIAVRIGNLYGLRHEQFVMIIDGGFKSSGETMVEHVQNYFDTDRVDLVVSTHPDADHAAGLAVVLEKMDVRRLWMHQPWDHSQKIRDLFHDGRITDNSLRERVQRALQNASDLENIAMRKGIPIDEPFSGGNLPFREIGITVLGPSEAYYESLLPGFRETPEARQETSVVGNVMTTIAAAATRAITWIAESWGVETLADPAEDATSAENNSSTILLLQVDGQKLLFTGDAGVPALDRAAFHAEMMGVDLTGVDFIQIPHHGSKRNVGPAILDRILGPRGQKPEVSKTAYVSASKDGAPKHPSRKVTNAFQRRGFNERVYATNGSAIRHRHNAPDRDGWGPLASLPFYDQVEE